ncbi:MAG: hypothetical protein JW724_07925 [Candidatus Altiarchaeota archaeon]|nr:hypothetical protein [Candidatus Altiarchaeota archaeon]
MKRFIVLLSGFLFLCSLCNADVTVSRDLPDSIAAGSSFTVSLAMVVSGSAPAAVGVTEVCPAGWVVSNVSYGGTDSGSDLSWLFWAFGYPVQNRTITYKVTVAETAWGDCAFSGTVDGGESSPVGGDTSVFVINNPVNVSRSMNSSVYQGTSFVVSLAMDVEGVIATDATVVEYYPSGWTVSDLSYGGVDLGDRIEWSFAPSGFPVEDRTITYSVTVPSAALGSYSFSGSFDAGYGVSGIRGSSTVSVNAHPVNFSRGIKAVLYQGAGAVVNLSMEVDEGNAPSAVSLTEVYPSGWTVYNVSYGGVDMGDSIVWSFAPSGFPVEDRLVTYAVSVPVEASGDHSFSGSWDAGYGSFAVGGSSIVHVPAHPVNVSRDIDAVLYVGGNASVGLAVDVDEACVPSSLAVTEHYPSGWTVSNVSYGGVDAGGRIDWLFSAESYGVEDCLLSYVLQVPGDLGDHSLNGSFSFGGKEYAVGGDSYFSVLDGCEINGDAPPCGTVTLAEVVAFINLWHAGEETLSDAVALIGVWAASA